MCAVLKDIVLTQQASAPTNPGHPALSYSLKSPWISNFTPAIEELAQAHHDFLAQKLTKLFQHRSILAQYQTTNGTVGLC
jgi:hypothetical protein